MSNSHAGSEQSLAALYLNRINFTGDFSATLANLQKLQFLHATHIPFGDTASFLGNGVPLGAKHLINKLLVQQREGYCFEHSLLTKRALSELGYDVVNRLGRVYYMASPEEGPAQTHLITLVNLEGEQYLYDPGFGGMTPTAPLSLNRIGQTQATPHEPFRFIHVNQSDLAANVLTEMHYMLQAYVLDKWINLYAFNPNQEVSPADINVANWYVSTSPDSLFTQHLVMAITTPEARINLRDNTLKIHSGSGSSQKTLGTAADFAALFEQTFKIQPGHVDYAALQQKINAMGGSESA